MLLEKVENQKSISLAFQPVRKGNKQFQKNAWITAS